MRANGRDIPDALARSELVLKVVNGVPGTLADSTLDGCAITSAIYLELSGI